MKLFGKTGLITTSHLLRKSCPIEIKAIGRKVPSWKVDQYGLCHELPETNAPKGEKENITLIPMGAARLRISAFPNTYE